MSRWVCGILAALAFTAPSAGLAHDIGVSQAELVELAGGAYKLSVQSTQRATVRFPAPALPERCEFLEGPRGTQGMSWKTFEFSCTGGLGPDDELSLPWLRDGVMLKATWADGSEVRRLFKNEAGAITVSLAELRVGSGSWTAAATRYTTLGIEHILEGYDHLLFVLALLIIVSNGWMLVKTITAFTLAHSITLALATLGLVNFPSRPVEAAIALSIVFLAVEILHARQGRVGLTYRQPWIVAFGFGLLHGFGFAGALSDIGLPQSEIPVALLFFNVGVEIGQLMFVGVVFAARWVITRANVRWPHAAELVPVYLIGTVATYWLFERVGGMLAPV